MTSTTPPLADIPSRNQRLATWLQRTAQQMPQQAALESPEGVWTYAELHALTLALSAQLKAAGLVPGDRIGIAATRSVSTIVSILSVIEAGLAYVPLDLSYPPERLLAMMEDAQARVVLGEPDSLATLRALLPGLPTLANPAPARAPVHGSAPDLAYVLFTSGSTGRPKGVAMGTSPLAHLIDWHASHPRLGRAARTLLFAPLSFDVHFQEIFSTLACGGTLVMVDEAVRRDPTQLHAALCKHRIARIFLPYVALQMLAQASEDRVPEFLQDVISAGEQLQISPAIRQFFVRLPHTALHNHYGPTESHVVTAYELPGEAAEWPDIPPIGLALPHVQLALLSVDSNTVILETPVTGELLLGGDTLAHGYLGHADLSAERFVSDVQGLPGRWYRTGDLVQRDMQGVCTYLGRADQQLKVDGFRIEPGEIELALMKHPGVRDAVVTAPDLPGIGKQLVAYLVLQPNNDETTVVPQVRALLREQLPEYMVPVRYVLLAALPTTPSGKIDRRGLPLPVLAAATPRTSADPTTHIRDLWQELLGLSDLGDHANLFDLGARSLLVLRFVTRMKEAGWASLNVADVYDHPTTAGIAAALRQQKQAQKTPRTALRATPSGTSAGIAIVGMACRTPGSSDVDSFWDNLLAGVEGIRHFAPHEVDASVPLEMRSRPNFVAARGVLENADRFDASFFGVSAREATVLDPQQRLMLELCWTALEHAGITPVTHGPSIGVYAGTANNTYLAALRAEQPELVEQYGEFATMLASEKDYVATRVAHRLNLTGPAVSIHTACSTGLVAVAQAWHALASGQCDVALAGGATVNVPQQNGYLHVEGGMESADGNCRPFDAQASGTVFASGGAVVVLKRIEDAQADGDTIYAVIRGVGLNNDGGNKASFTAPSVSGQARAIRLALDHAQLSARSIGYVEAHGTGTALGDPIEVAALVRAWQEDTPDTQFCTLGSLKGNLGHMVAAAGVAGLIKAALALHREVIPGTLHYQTPNPQLDLAHSPFQVRATATPWPRLSATPRRAAVSSFGVGGTNAHVVIEEAPAIKNTPSAENVRWVLPISARDAAGVAARAVALAEHLRLHPLTPLMDVAATLMRGRQAMAQRLSIVASSAAEAIAALQETKNSITALQQPRVVFLFPGQGSQHPGMARQLYAEASAFREALDQCLAIAEPALGIDLRAWLVDADPADEAIARKLAETRHAQPALFAVSYALAAWLESLGVLPDAMIGHSIGEYTAACRAGVMPLADALRAVIARGQAMYAQPPGAMLAVRCDAATLQPLLPAGVELAGINAPALTVVAGSTQAIDALAPQLEARDIGCTRLRVSHAFHSAAMDGALPAVALALAQANLQAPHRTLYSCVSGEPLQAQEAMAPSYWARQVREPVQFSRALQAELAQHGATVFIEVGPGQALTALLRQHRTSGGTVPHHVPLLGPANQPGLAAQHALAALGRLWCLGIPVAWPMARSARRAVLPTYPWRDDRHWFKRSPCATAPTTPLASTLLSASTSAAITSPMTAPHRLPRLVQELQRIVSDVSGVLPEEVSLDQHFLDQGLDSLSLTQATLEIERVFGIKLRFRRLMEDLNTLSALVKFLDAELPADRFAPAPVEPPTPVPLSAPATMAASINAPLASPISASGLQALIYQQMQLMQQQLALLAGQPTAAAAMAAPMVTAAQPPTSAAPAEDAASAEPNTPVSLVDQPFGASPRLTLNTSTTFTPAQQQWLNGFIARYNARSGRSKAFSQQHRQRMADPRVATGFNPLWKDLVYPLVVDRSQGAKLWDVDGNEYIDLLSAFGANLLGYQPPAVVAAMQAQLQAGIEVGPQHPLAAEVAELIAGFTGMERVAFCNTGSEAVMGAMRMARTVTGRKTIAIFSNSYHGIFDEVIVRGTKQLRSLSAAPGILANAVENILVLDWDSEDSLRVLRERGHELAAIMTEPVQNKYPTVQPRTFIAALRQIADTAGCALIFDEVVTGFRLAPGGAQEFYGVRADIATYGKIIGGGLPFAAIAGGTRWLDALDGGHWQYGDDSYPEAGVTYFAGTFVRHPLALAAARATLLHLKNSGPAFYQRLNQRTQNFIERLNTAFALSGAPVQAVHCASLWRLAWDDNQKFVSLFYYLARFHGLHLYEQFGHFVTEAMGDAELDRVFTIFTEALAELMALGLITPRPTPPPEGGGPTGGLPQPSAAAPEAAPAPEAPLTPGQTERWLAASFDSSARRALNESFCLTLQGRLNRPALHAALHDVLARHEAFRTQFSLEEPLQSVGIQHAPAIAEIDLSGDPNADAALDDFCTQASLRDFALDAAPLAALSLLCLGAERHVVHLVASHLVFDGWAASVFVSELATAYQARALGRVAQMPKAETPRAFAQRLAQTFESEPGQESLKFWQHTLASPPQPLNLGDREPTTPRTHAADTLRHRLPSDTVASLRTQARAHGVTLFQLLLSAVTVVLRQRSGQSDFILSLPYAAQALERLGPLMADGVLDLPLRLRLEPQMSAPALLKHVRSTVMDALDHPLMTQGTIARALGLPSRGSRPPLTGVFFNLNPRVDLTGFAPLIASLHEGRKQGILSELFFNFHEGPDSLTLDLHYSTEFFSPSAAQALVHALIQRCTAWAADINTPLQWASEPQSPPQPPLIDPRLRAWNATAAPLAAHSRIENWVSQQATATPEAPALAAGAHTLSYAQLETLANQIAHRLRERGAAPGQRIGVCLERGPALVPALLAVLKTGAAYVPLDPGFPPERLSYMAHDADLQQVITEAAHAALCPIPRAQQLRVDDDAALIQSAPHAPVMAPADAPEDATAYVIYTSGSTGQPKGVVLPQQAVCNFLASMQREPGMRSTDRLLAVTTLSFDIAVLELFLPLTSGACTVLAQREDAMDGEALAELIAQQRITVMQATPTTWHLLLDAGWQAPRGFRALCGGEPLPPALAARILAAGAQLWNLYGPTETTVWSTLSHITDAQARIHIGRPIANTQVWVLDEHHHTCPVGQEGEICIGGMGVASGYYKRADLTADRFVPDPYCGQPEARLYRTGDLGRWNEDGTLSHLGRLDFQVKVRGHRIELGEIEAQLDALAGVARSVVMAREDSPGDVRLVAYLVIQPGHMPSPELSATRLALRNTLPDYMLPQHLVLLPALPLLPNGKIDRKVLPPPSALAASVASPTPIKPDADACVTPLVPPSAPNTSASLADLTHTISRAMAELLGLPQVAAHEHFFELGGHSLLAAKLAARLRPLVGQRINLRTLFEHATPAALALALAPSAPSTSAPGRAATAATLAAAQTAMQIAVRRDQRSAPLSLMQQRLWFLENLSPGTPYNQLPSGHRLTGPLDATALRHAFAQLVARQSALRTVIERTPEGPRQRVIDTVTLALGDTEDLRSLPADQREARARERIAEMAQTSLDFEKNPAWMAHLFQIDDEVHVLFFMAHHLVWDGSSFDVLYQDLAELYAAQRAQRPAVLPPITVSYGDYAEWQREWMQGDELARQLAHWRETLTPLPEPLALPTDRPRPVQMSGNGGSSQCLLPPDLLAALRTLARAQGSTVSTVVLATYAALLQKMAQQDDFAIVTPVRGREQPELEPLMGFFVNALPLRMQPEGRLPFADWAKRVQHVVSAAFACPDVPFEHMVQALHVPRDTSRPPIAQVLYSYQDVRERPRRWAEIEHTRFDIALYGSSHDLSLYCVELATGLECALTYNSDVFDAASAALLLPRLESLLRQIVAQPQQRLCDLQIATETEQQRRAQANATAAPFDAQADIHTLIARQATQSPHAPAVVQWGLSQLSYDELNGRANRLAHLLRSRGVGRGQLVGLCVERTPEMVVAQLAVLKAGAAYVPLDPAYPADRLAYMAEDARLALLVTESTLAHLLNWPHKQSILLDIDAPTIDALPCSALEVNTTHDATPEDPAYVIYTSGSTGRPKGVVVPHRAVVNFLTSMAREPGLNAQDRLLAVTTLSFDIAVLELLLPLTVGAQVVLASQEQAVDGQALSQLISISGATVMQATPSTWRMLIESGWQGSSHFKALVGGESLPLDLAQQLNARTGQLWNMYGPTETTVWSTLGLVTNPEQGIRIGRPIANTQVHVLDAQQKPCPLGVPGELFIGGDGVTLGYLHRPELSAERFVPDPARPGHTLYRTGDRGRWCADDQIEHLGRLDFQVKVRGHRIELGEIEIQLTYHPAVARSLVIVREDHPGDQRLVAYVVARKGTAMPDAAILREHLRASLPEYMLPQHVLALPSIPLLPNGKVDRHALPIPHAISSVDSSVALQPSSAAEAEIAQIWKALLGIDHLNVTDNFFNLGGHSLLAMRAVIEIEKQLGIRINVRRLIFESLAQIAASAANEPTLSAIKPIAETSILPAHLSAPAPQTAPRVRAGLSVWVDRLMGRNQRP